MTGTTWKYYTDDKGKEFLAYWEVEGDPHNKDCDITIRLSDKYTQHGWPVGVERIYFSKKFKNEKGNIINKEYIIGDKKNKLSLMKKNDLLSLADLFNQIIDRNISELSPRTLKILKNARAFFNQKMSETSETYKNH